MEDMAHASTTINGDMKVLSPGASAVNESTALATLGDEESRGPSERAPQPWPFSLDLTLHTSWQHSSPIRQETKGKPHPALKGQQFAEERMEFGFSGTGYAPSGARWKQD